MTLTCLYAMGTSAASRLQVLRKDTKESSGVRLSTMQNNSSRENRLIWNPVTKRTKGSGKIKTEFNTVYCMLSSLFKPKTCLHGRMRRSLCAGQVQESREPEGDR